MNQASPGPFDGMSLPDLAGPTRPPLAHDVVSKLLEMGFASPRRPIDRLIERLTSPAGASWLVEALRLAQVGCPGDADAGFARGRFGLGQLEDVKNRCKLAALTDSDTNVRLAATAGYYLAIAAASVHYDRVISSQPRSELATMMIDFAAAASQPWSALLAQAGLNLGTP